MQYLFVAMWLAVGLILMISLAKESKIFLLAGSYFILLAIWWFLNIIWDGVMFAGTLGIGFKIFSGGVLSILLIHLIRHRNDGKPATTVDQDDEGK